jgi:DnaJ-class molecular chaperone
MKTKNGFTYKDLVWAREVLGLPLSATQTEIKMAHKEKVKKWHPDHCVDKKAHQKMTEINKAYEVIVNYCRKYRYSFDIKTFRKNMIGTQWWWLDKFGQDPIWGNKAEDE